MPARADALDELAPPLDFPPYSGYPPLRFMGSKHRLLPWIQSVIAELEFDTALDAFSGSGCVSYLLKTMGKEPSSLHYEGEPA